MLNSGGSGEEPIVRQETAKEKEDFEGIISVEFRRHFDLDGFEEAERNIAEQGIDATFYHPGNDETKKIFLYDGIVLVLRDFHQSKLIKGRSLGSYAAWPVVKVNHLHTSNYPTGYRDAKLDSETDFKKLKQFIEGEYQGLIPQKGVEIKDGALHIKMDSRTEKIPLDWNTLSGEELMKYESTTPWYRPEVSPFTEVLSYISRNGFEELAKHQYEIVVAKRKHAFDKINHLINWRA